MRADPGRTRWVDGLLYVKVRGFRDPGQRVTEALWVRVTEGNEEEGVGVLDTPPLLTCTLGLGDHVLFATSPGGCQCGMPHYFGRVNLLPAGDA